ncbi:hypothetical protein [Corynebacterium crudilactis]|uniref:hypothetical protein n=1 Tax=Corynebacterium crudilactis TaxID=1652495 RepID=UPI00093F8952|nr:hypothetical protein [Corynebacterium crudilactis]
MITKSAAKALFSQRQQKGKLSLLGGFAYNSGLVPPYNDAIVRFDLGPVENSFIEVSVTGRDKAMPLGVFIEKILMEHPTYYARRSLEIG